MEAARVQDTSLGRICISSHAIAQIVERTASECYGVVGLGSGRRARRLFPLARPRAVEMEQGSDGIALALRIVVAYGLNLAEVAASVHSRVSYDVQRLTGLPVSSLEVRIDDLRAPK